MMTFFLKDPQLSLNNHWFGPPGLVADMQPRGIGISAILIEHLSVSWQPEPTIMVQELTLVLLSKLLTNSQYCGNILESYWELGLLLFENMDWGYGKLRKLNCVSTQSQNQSFPNQHSMC